MNRPFGTEAPGPALVTGGTGFIGSHLVRRLVAAGWKVHVLVRPTRTTPHGLVASDRVAVLMGDVTDPASLERAVERAAPAVIFHLASRTDLRFSDSGLSGIEASVAVNLSGTLNILRAAEAGNVSRVVRAGGIEEYGTGACPSSEDQREEPVSPYSASQVAATHYCQMLQPHLACTIVTLRPSLVYGPRQGTDFLIPSLIRACLEGRDFALGAGHHGRDLLYVDDLVEGFLKAATAPGLAGKVINLGSGCEHLVREVAELIVRLSGADIELRSGPARPRFIDQPHLGLRIDRAAELLDWTPTIPLEEGLRRTIAWYRAAGVPTEPTSMRGT